MTASPPESRPFNPSATKQRLAESLEKARQQRQALATGKAKTQDRTNIDLEAEITADPVEFMRKQLTEMLVQETAVNASLYRENPVKNKELSDSTKRLIDLGDALKALPSQSTQTNAGQRSLAQAIVEALEARDRETSSQELQTLAEATKIRAEQSFGDGQ